MDCRILSMPFGPSVLFTRSDTASAPTKDARRAISPVSRSAAMLSALASGCKASARAADAPTRTLRSKHNFCSQLTTCHKLTTDYPPSCMPHPCHHSE